MDAFPFLLLTETGIILEFYVLPYEIWLFRIRYEYGSCCYDVLLSSDDRSVLLSIDQKGILLMSFV